MRKISKIRTLQAQYERHVFLTTSPHSYEKYARALEHFMKKFPEKRGPRDYYSTDIEDYKILRLREGATPSYVRYELSVIRNFFQWMLDYHEGLIEYNPASEVRVGRTERTPAKVHPEEIYKTIFDSLVLPRERVLLLFAALTGLGPKEISRVERSDIDFDKAMLLTS
jgi:integrase